MCGWLQPRDWRTRLPIGACSCRIGCRHRRVKGARRQGVPVSNWLTAEQGKTLLQSSCSDTLRGKRDRAILSVLLGCGLRRAELVALSVQDLQIRDDHWVFADLIGKGKHIRTVPVPGWVKTALDDWTANADITGGNIFRRVNKNGVVWGEEISPKAIWHVVRRAAQRAGIQGLAPNDLRQTCARLCHLAGGELEQLQFLLGHASIETNDTWAASRNSEMLLTTNLGWKGNERALTRRGLGTLAIAVAIVTGLSSVGAHVSIRMSRRNAAVTAVSREIQNICTRLS